MADTILKSIIQELAENENWFLRLKWKNLQMRS